MHLLITRPKAQAEKTASALRKMGHQCTVEPLLTIEALPGEVPEGEFGGLILTSANSVHILDGIWPDTGRENIPVLTTGTATSATARRAGFTRIGTVDGSALDIVAHAVEWMDNQNISRDADLLYPCAETIAHDLPQLLAQQSVSCTAWPVYRTIAAKRFNASTQKALADNQIDGVLLYSARTAVCFMQLFAQLASKPPEIFALSAEIRDTLSPQLAEYCQIPQKPSEEALFELLEH